MTKWKKSALPVAVLSLLIAGFAADSTRAQDHSTPNAQLASKDLNARVEALLKQMTLEEKIGADGAILRRICNWSVGLEPDL